MVPPVLDEMLAAETGIEIVLVVIAYTVRWKLSGLRPTWSKTEMCGSMPRLWTSQARLAASP
ncbi:hypothetical protein IH86_14685 [Sphingobium yanoikuyae]|nr:hypothetical protein IH86_14685 [Sphingobium yanoikuyae]